MMEWEKQLHQQHEEESNINNNNNNTNNISNKNGMFVKVMTDEQMEILRKQIAAYATICDNLVDMHKSLTSNPLLHVPGDRLGNLYSGPLVTSVGHKITGRQRWTPTTIQLQILEHMFDQGNGTPTKQRIKDITSELSQHGQISETNVYNWFQNRRARSKRKQQVATPNNGESEVEAEVESTNDIETKSANQSPRAEKNCLQNPEISSGMHSDSVDLQVIKPVFVSNESAKPSRSLGHMSFYDSMVSTPRIDYLVGKIEDSRSYNSYMRAEDFDLS